MLPVIRIFGPRVLIAAMFNTEQRMRGVTESEFGTLLVFRLLGLPNFCACAVKHGRCGSRKFHHLAWRFDNINTCNNASVDTYQVRKRAWM